MQRAIVLVLNKPMYAKPLRTVKFSGEPRKYLLSESSARLYGVFIVSVNSLYTLNIRKVKVLLARDNGCCLSIQKPPR